MQGNLTKIDDYNQESFVSIGTQCEGSVVIVRNRKTKLLEVLEEIQLKDILQVYNPTGFLETPPITEIVSVNNNKLKFRTKSSLYILTINSKKGNSFYSEGKAA